MKRLFVYLIVVIVALGFVSTSHAELVAMDLGGCVSYLDGNDFSEGYGGSARLKIEVLEILAVDARAGYVRFRDTDVTVYPIEIAALLQLPIGPINLYGGLGVGQYTFNTAGDAIDDAFGYFPLAGVDLGSGRMRLFVEMRWLSLTADVDAALKELEGIAAGGEAEADGVGVNVGWNIHF
jgi:hypothetical protein